MSNVPLNLKHVTHFRDVFDRSGNERHYGRMKEVRMKKYAVIASRKVGE